MIGKEEGREGGRQAVQHCPHVRISSVDMGGLSLSFLPGNPVSAHQQRDIFLVRELCPFNC